MIPVASSSVPALSRALQSCRFSSATRKDLRVEVQFRVAEHGENVFQLVDQAKAAQAGSGATRFNPISATTDLTQKNSPAARAGG